MPLASPVTSTGVSRSVVDPSPNSPTPLLPQHLTPPVVVRAQVWRFPAAMAAAPLLRPVTSTGVRLANVVVPFPNAPLLFLPQHFTPPAMVRAQVCWVPKETAVTPLVRPDTFTGVELLEVVPLPSEPTRLRRRYGRILRQPWSRRC